jgi:hypothetical protein
MSREGGGEFVHGDAPVTLPLMHEAQLSLSPTSGTRWSVHTGALSRDEVPFLVRTGFTRRCGN